jgi:hypothetical protein
MVNVGRKREGGPPAPPTHLKKTPVIFPVSYSMYVQSCSSMNPPTPTPWVIHLFLPPGQSPSPSQSRFFGSQSQGVLIPSLNQSMQFPDFLSEDWFRRVEFFFAKTYWHCIYSMCYKLKYPTESWIYFRELQNPFTILWFLVKLNGFFSLLFTPHAKALIRLSDLYFVQDLQNSWLFVILLPFIVYGYYATNLTPTMTNILDRNNLYGG